MIKYQQFILLLLAVLQHQFANTQDISGKWIGDRSDTKITMDIIQQNDSIYGNAFIIFERGLGKANVAIKGRIKNGVLEYETSKVLEEDIDSNYLLCFVSGKDFLKIKKNKHVLEGTCLSIDVKDECINLSCNERYIKKVDYTFRKDNFYDRKVLVIDTILAKSDSLELVIWDNLKEDGDIVSVYFNEHEIISNLLLKHQPFKTKINCNTELNVLLFYAHNLGDVPPNTATLAIYQNGKLLKELDIKSDADRSESIVIKLQKN